MPTVPHLPLQALAAATFLAAGSEHAEASAIASQLVGANLAGHDSHGVGLVPTYIELARAGLAVQNQHISVVSDTGAVIVVDGQAGFGAVIGRESMDLGIAAAADHGLGLVAIRNSIHLGRIGHWAEHCARSGMVSMHFVNVVGHPPLVAPFGGVDARFGTNPICIAIPGGDEGTPLAMADLATSTIALGKAREAFNQGVSAPPGTLIDGDGRPTVDPGVMFVEPTGALVAMGQHKGSALAVMVELLGALTGGTTMQPGNPRTGTVVNNMISIIIDPDAIGGAEFLASEGGAFLDYVKAARPVDGADEVLLPGEPEKRTRQRRLTAGIEVSDGAWSLIVDAARSVGVGEEVIDCCG
jgi:uncharacterized oxidoreductase